MQTTEIKAEFFAWQDFSKAVIGRTGLEPFPLFTLRGGKRDGSTVAKQTLLKEGITIPDYPTLDQWRNK